MTHLEPALPRMFDIGRIAPASPHGSRGSPSLPTSPMVAGFRWFADRPDLCEHECADDAVPVRPPGRGKTQCRRSASESPETRSRGRGDDLRVDGLIARWSCTLPSEKVQVSALVIGRARAGPQAVPSSITRTRARGYADAPAQGTKRTRDTGGLPRHGSTQPGMLSQAVYRLARHRAPTA